MSATKLPRTKRRLLVVDDEPQILVAISDLFEDDFEVLTAGDGWGALRLLEEHDVSVILSDQRMPGMPGDEFLQRARDVSEATRVLVTGYTDITALVRAVNIGKIHAYVAKPWNPVELRAIVMNAAAQYELTQDLSHERSLLKALMDNVPDAIFFLDRGLRFERANRAQAEHLGEDDPRELVGKTIADFLPSAVAEGILADERRALETGEMVVDKVERQETPQGICTWMSTTKAPIRNKQGEIVGLVGISRNITGRRLAEEALQRAHDDLERIIELRTRKLKQEIAERMRAEEMLIEAKEMAESANRAKTAFLANMSHELRTPLNAIIGFADLMRSHIMGPVGNEKYEEYIYNIYESGIHLLNIISDILDVSRIEAGKIKLQESDVDLPAIAQGAMRMMEHLAEEGELTAVVEIFGEVPRVFADERLVKQALLNLLSNAIKFTPPNGRVTVRVAEQRDGSVTLSVSDSGIGISATDIERVLQPFGQVESSLARKHAGTGLGLPLAKAFMDLHGGYFELLSEVGKGTTAGMHFPSERVLRGQIATL